MVTWTLSEYALLGLVVGGFALVGLLRGVNRELLSAIGVGIAILLAEPAATALGPQVNLFVKLGQLAFSGGLAGGDLGASWSKIREAESFIQTPDDMRLFGVALFLLMVALAYAIGQIRIQAPAGPVLRVLGLMAGGVNGFLIAFYLFPILFPKPTALIAVPSGQVQATLTSGSTIARVVLVFVVVLIALGLYSASRRPVDRR
jgi:uncharacterized membrane protein required for colicin V production